MRTPCKVKLTPQSAPQTPPSIPRQPRICDIVIFEPSGCLPLPAIIVDPFWSGTADEPTVSLFVFRDGLGLINGVRRSSWRFRDEPAA
jgi:hypothetical protein